MLNFRAAFWLTFMPPSFLAIQAETQSSVKFLGLDDATQAFKNRSSPVCPHNSTIRRPTYFPFRSASRASIAEMRSWITEFDLILSLGIRERISDTAARITQKIGLSMIPILIINLERPYRNPTRYDLVYCQLFPSCPPTAPSWIEDRLSRCNPLQALIRPHRHAYRSFQYGFLVASLIRRTYAQASKIQQQHHLLQI